MIPVEVDARWLMCIATENRRTKQPGVTHHKLLSTAGENGPPGGNAGLPSAAFARGPSMDGPGSGSLDPGLRESSSHDSRDFGASSLHPSIRPNLRAPYFTHRLLDSPHAQYPEYPEDFEQPYRGHDVLNVASSRHAAPGGPVIIERRREKDGRIDRETPGGKRRCMRRTRRSRTGHARTLDIFERLLLGTEAAPDHPYFTPGEEEKWRQMPPGIIEARHFFILFF